MIPRKWIKKRFPFKLFYFFYLFGREGETISNVSIVHCVVIEWCLTVNTWDVVQGKRCNAVRGNWFSSTTAWVSWFFATVEESGRSAFAGKHLRNHNFRAERRSQAQIYARKDALAHKLSRIILTEAYVLNIFGNTRFSCFIILRNHSIKTHFS